ncbi:portal protein, partial [Listeria monocytogenes]|uniref:portal protein n=1 Tax=Listeria monocytogenes TaxID=1639 RepID=UPI002FDC400B
MAPRWEITGEDVYGYGAGWDSLGDIKALQQEQRRKLQLIDKGNAPPLVGPSSLRNSTVSQLPGAITFLDVHQGQQGIVPLYQPNPNWLQ